MYNQAKNLTKNTAAFIVALVLQKIISFTYFSYLATRLGAENLGKYFFALSFSAIFHVLADLGLINILIRDSAKDQNNSQKLLSYNLAIKIPLSIFVYLSLILISFALGYSTELKSMIALSGIIMVFDSFTLTFYGVFRGFHNLRFESLGTIIFQAIVVIFGLNILRYTTEPFYIIFAILAASLFNFFYTLSLVKYKLKLKLKPLYHKLNIISLLKTTIPFALAGIFTKIYAYIDTVFLSLFSTQKDIGYYSIPYKMVFSLQFIPMAFVAALYPLFSYFYKKDRAQLTKYFEQSVFLLLLIIVPITIGTLLLGDQLIIKVYGTEYIPSILSLQILMLGLVFVFLNFPVTYLLNACYRQRKVTINIGIVMLINIILNIILIKFLALSFIGASLASSISSVILLIINFFLIINLIKLHTKILLLKVLKILISGLAMAIFIIYFKIKINFILVIIAAAAIYCLFILLTRTVTKNDIITITKLILKKSDAKSSLDNQ